MPLTREEKLERKKLSERRRRERIKHNEEFKAKNRARYYKRKAEGKIISIHDLNRHEQKARREKSRISSRKHNLKKKSEAKRCLVEELIQVPEIYKKESHDPFEEPLTPLLLSRADSPVSSPSDSSFRLSVSGDAPAQWPLSRNSYSSEAPNPSSNSSSFSSRRSARLNPVGVEPSGSDTQSANQTQNVTETPKRTTSTGCVLRRFKYKVNKEFQLLHERITELEAVNAKYKKQIYRMKNKTYEPQPSTSKTENRKEIVTENIIEGFRKEIEESVKLFFEDDEDSQLCSKNVLFELTFY